MKHEVGLGIVSAGIFIFGAVKKLGSQIDDIAQTSLKAADLDDAVVKKLDEIGEEGLSKIDDAVDPEAGKAFNKYVKETDVKTNFYEYEAGTLNITKRNKGSKLNEGEVEQTLNQEKAFVEVGNLDEIAASGTPIGDEVQFIKGAKGGWNKSLNKTLKKNSKYKIGKHTYETDGAGRVSGVKGELELKTIDKNNYQQRKSVTSKAGLPTDQGGHLVASIFDGAGEQINLVPMLANLNQGAWRTMENTWKAGIQAGKKVEIDIKIIYEGASMRPVGFKVDSWENGVKQLTKIFEN